MSYLKEQNEKNKQLTRVILFIQLQSKMTDFLNTKSPMNIAKKLKNSKHG